MKSILVDVDPTGQAEVSAHGYKGKGCQNEVTKHLEKALGAVKAVKHKPEYYQDEKVKQTVG